VKKNEKTQLGARDVSAQKRSQRERRRKRIFQGFHGRGRGKLRVQRNSNVMTGTQKIRGPEGIKGKGWGFEFPILVERHRCGKGGE